jgi:ribosome biogenesis protein ENP2
LAVKGKGKDSAKDMLDGVSRGVDNGVELTWVPSSSSKPIRDDDNLIPNGASSNKTRQDRRSGIESFGSGLERGMLETRFDLNNKDTRGRTQRRKGVRSGSKNTFRRI